MIQVAIGAACLVAGYALGRRRASVVVPVVVQPESSKDSKSADVVAEVQVQEIVLEEPPNPESKQPEEENDDEVEDISDGDLSSIKPVWFEGCKLVCCSSCVRVEMFS